MNIIDRIARRLGYVKATNNAWPATLLAQADAGRFQIPDGSLAATQAELYQRLSWVFTAVNTVAQAAATTNFQVYRLENERQLEIVNHPFELLLQHPNPLQSRYELLKATFSYWLLTGKAYWWLNRPVNEGAPLEIWLLPPQHMQPIPDERLYLRGYKYDPGGGQAPLLLETTEVVHFRRFHPRNQFVGLSAIESIAVAAVGDMKMTEWNTNYFAQINANIPGILAWADPIPDAVWQRMQADIKRQHGGTKRQLMMLRNVGKGGVQWLPTAMSQKDMEFLAGRNLTKEEIFGVLAPGLASMLAVNATEANARAGKATLMEHAVYPLHKAVAEKITLSVLPAYGEQLVGRFDDVRLTDRAMLIQEQRAAGEVLTINEVREKYYQLPPLPDGDRLVRENRWAAPEANSALETADAPASEVKTNPPWLADLRRWERFAVKRLKAGKPLREFRSDSIPPILYNALRGALALAETADEATALFAEARRWRGDEETWL